MKNKEIAISYAAFRAMKEHFSADSPALRGWGGSEAKDGIKAAMEIFGTVRSSDAIPAAKIEEYMQREWVLTGSFEDKLKQIITQQWMHRLENPIEAYFDWRRTGYPVLTPGDSQGETGGTIPRRGNIILMSRP